MSPTGQTEHDLSRYIPSNFFSIPVCFLLITLADISTLAVTPSLNLPLKITPQRHADGRTSEQSNHASACQFVAHKGAHATIWPHSRRVAFQLLLRGLFPRHLRAANASIFVHAPIRPQTAPVRTGKGKKSVKKIVQNCAGEK